MRIENAKVFGLGDSVKASKYPMTIDPDTCTDEVTKGVDARATCDKGTGHDQFLTGIIVQFDLTFTLKAWIEAERYHFFDFVSSMSTMHRITKMDVRKQCNVWTDPEIIEILQKKIDAYNSTDEHLPGDYLRILYNIPTGYQLTARMTTNYRQLKTIYAQRHDHRLPEWRDFCKWMETYLPHSEWITGEVKKDEGNKEGL